MLSDFTIFKLLKVNCEWVQKVRCLFNKWTQLPNIVGKASGKAGWLPHYVGMYRTIEVTQNRI